jgi:GT2 family glycosyltransferase
MSNPKFSLIIGVYNQAATLPLLIESLKVQTFKDFEVHFCDDGSDDGSFEMLQALAEMRRSPEDLEQNIFVHQQPHKGMRLAKNLNQGILRARGEYCVLVMGDSMIEADYLEVLSEYVNEERIVCGIRVQIAQNAEGQPEGVDMDWRLKKNLIPEVASVIMGQPWNCLTGNGLTIPTSAFHEHGLLDEELEGYGGEDTEIVARLFHKGYVCWSVPDLRLYHHWHKSNDSNPKTAAIVSRKLKEYAN